MFLGKKISIVRSNPKQKRKDSASHRASGEHAQSSNQTFEESRAPHSAANKRSVNIQLKGRNTFAMPRNVRPLDVPSTNSKAREVEDGKPNSNYEFREMILKK
ncbi:uncharacterized protein LOC116128965 [Pistacia vera]|uniref:uncharacterized protein LOC116128965 n=1 Tax=Pistacia vera TaxID=55513 RepID=UPI001262E9B6|nr:uncharacterized protein LOC116128965 [Pistacia vera]